MKKIISVFCVLAFLSFSAPLSAQLKPVKKEVKPKGKITPVKIDKKTVGAMKKKEAEDSRTVSPDTSGRVLPAEALRRNPVSANQAPAAPAILSVPDKTGYNQGFRVSGTGNRLYHVNVYFKALWKEGNSQKSKTNEPITFPVESDGNWRAKIERPYVSIPATAQDIRFEITATQTVPNGKTSAVAGPSVVRGTMAAPTITGSRGDVSMTTRTNPYGGGPTVTYAELYGKAFPNMSVSVTVATEYQTPKQQYSSGSDNMRTAKYEGETVTVKADASGNWTVKRIVVPVPGNVPFGIYNPKLVVTAVQSASQSDVSAEAMKKINIKTF